MRRHICHGGRINSLIARRPDNPRSCEQRDNRRRGQQAIPSGRDGPDLRVEVLHHGSPVRQEVLGRIRVEGIVQRMSPSLGSPYRYGLWSRFSDSVRSGHPWRNLFHRLTMRRRSRFTESTAMPR